MQGIAPSALRFLRITVGPLLFAAMAVPSTADLRLERTRSIQMLDRDGEVDSSRERAEVVFIGESSARLDLGSESAIVRVDEGVFLWLDHGAKAYAELALPLKLEDLFTDEEKSCLRLYSQALLNADASVTLTDEHRVIGGWETRKLRVEGRHPRGFRFEEEKWITHSLPVDLGPYFQVIQNRAALSTVTRAWFGQFVAAGGYPVESTRTMGDPGRVRVVKQRLEAVNEVAADGSRYLPPAGYAPTLTRPPLDVQCRGTPRQ